MSIMILNCNKFLRFGGGLLPSDSSVCEFPAAIWGVGMLNNLIAFVGKRAGM